MVEEEDAQRVGAEEEEEAELVVAGSPHQDPPHIVKGKRTKRQRPQSPPIPFTITTPYSSSGEGGYVNNGENCININNDNNNNNNDNNNNNNNNNNNDNNNNKNSNSSSSSAEQVPRDYSTTTEEDEYTASCLILLAQGGRRQHDRVVTKEPSFKLDQDQDFGIPEKFNSKRYIETPTSGNGKAGMYVYECKTCGRTFPSFQALGGHRASHKKPKNIAAALKEKKMMFMDVSDDDDEDRTFRSYRHNNNKDSSSLSLEFITNHRGNNNNSSSSNSHINLQKSASFRRIHECSHCGAEFTSGQALGGHMRRHRGTPTIANTTLSLGQLSPETMDLQDSDQEMEANRKRLKHGLILDLNLPAPEDDHHHHHHQHNKESKFGLGSKQVQHQQQQQQKQQEENPQQQQKSAHVLSSSTKLVDCRY